MRRMSAAGAAVGAGHSGEFPCRLGFQTGASSSRLASGPRSCAIGGSPGWACPRYSPAAWMEWVTRLIAVTTHAVGDGKVAKDTGTTADQAVAPMWALPACRGAAGDGGVGADAHVVGNLDLVVEARPPPALCRPARRGRWWYWRRSRSRRRSARRRAAAPDPVVAIEGQAEAVGADDRAGCTSTRRPKRTRATRVTRATRRDCAPTTQSAPDDAVRAEHGAVLDHCAVLDHAAGTDAGARGDQCAGGHHGAGMDARGRGLTLEQGGDLRVGDVGIAGDQRCARTLGGVGLAQHDGAGQRPRICAR